MPDNNKKKPEGGQQYDVPVEGSLGLLALGAVGLKAWREKKLAVKRNSGNKKNGK